MNTPRKFVYRANAERIKERVEYYEKHPDAPKLATSEERLAWKQKWMDRAMSGGLRHMSDDSFQSLEDDAAAYTTTIGRPKGSRKKPANAELLERRAAKTALDRRQAELDKTGKKRLVKGRMDALIDEAIATVPDPDRQIARPRVVTLVKNRRV
jgi:hypothetical protein